MHGLPREVRSWIFNFFYREHSVAYLKIDAEHCIAAKGGNLKHYGLSSLRIGKPVSDQLEFMYVVAYFTLDILRLRILTTAAAICLAVYFYSQPAPLMNVVGWNVFFVLLNLIQIGRILTSRYVKVRSHSRGENAGGRMRNGHS